MTLLTEDNEPNLEPGFVAKRSQTLTAAEIRVLLKAEWEDIEHSERFLPSMTLWDNLKHDIPPLLKTEPMVLAVDAAVGRITGYSDCFGLLGVTRHPNPEFKDSQLFVRYTNSWQAAPGEVYIFGNHDVFCIDANNYIAA